MKSKYVSCLYIAAMLSSMTTFIGCEEIPDGYISDKIIYRILLLCRKGLRLPQLHLILMEPPTL